jgi:hypothetical protein
MKEEPKSRRMRAPDGTTMQMKTNNDGSSELKMSDGSTMKTDSQGNITIVQPGGASQPMGR